MLIGRVWPARPSLSGNFSDFNQVRREMMRLLDSFAADTWSEPGAGVFPPVNVTQDADNFYVRAEIPGVDANELSISALKNRLTLTGKREIQREGERVSYHRRERAEGAFSRTITLPNDVDAERVDARYTDGILSLKLPKAEAAKPRQIAVRS